VPSELNTTPLPESSRLVVSVLLATFHR
jgi:hypothetical protein